MLAVTHSRDISIAAYSNLGQYGGDMWYYTYIVIALLLFIVFGLFFGYFATLNTALVSIHFGAMSVPQIPMYVLVILSFALGVVFASLFYFVKYVAVQLSIRRNSQELDDNKKTSAELLKKIHQLELENTKLKVKNGVPDVDADSI